MLEITGVKFKCGNFSSQIWDDSRHRRFLIFYRKMWVLNKSVVQRRERWAENQGLCGPKWVLHSVKFLRTSLGTALTGPIPAPVSRCQWTEWSFENLTQILSLLCSLPNGFFFFFLNGFLSLLPLPQSLQTHWAPTVYETPQPPSHL